MSTLVGYGVSPWGIGAWGDGYSEIVQGFGKAYAVGDRVVRVEMTVEPLHTSILGEGDALNPRSWQILDPATRKLWNLLSVRQVNSKTFEILTLESLPRYFTELELSSGELRTVDEVPFPTLSFLFNGCYLAVNDTPETRLAANGILQKDITNAIVPSVYDSNSQAYSDLSSGTLDIDSAGDYTTQFGETLVRKLILRRLIAKKGDFFHLPNYGLGLRVKEPLPVSDLRKLAAAIEQEINKEPEVQASKVKLSYSASASVLNVFIQVRLQPDGQVAQFPLVVPTGLVQL